MNYCKATIGGRLTRDPEIRVTPNGTAVAQFSVAISRKYKASDGNMAEETSFIDCEAWGKTAENTAKFFTKGRPILCDGRLKQDSWEDKNTKEKRSRIKVVVEAFYFVDSNKSDTPKPPAPQGEQQKELGEDVPF